MSYVKFENVSKKYDQTTAAENVNLSVSEGEFFSLLGPSGCGKTTLLRLIAGFIRPDEGKIYINGKSIENVAPEKRSIGMVFQNYALFPHLSVAENVAFGLSVKHVDKNEVRQRVNEALELVVLSELRERYPRQLSGGQQQRVALARALVTKPSVLLLDEPLAALDKQLRTQMQVELRQLQRRLGITAIFVTHDQEEAMTLSDRIAVMKAGQIIQTGTPTEIYERPQTEFISNFLGSSNFFRGKLLSIENELAKVAFSPEITLECRWQAPLQSGAEITLAVRPEKVRIFSQRPPLPNIIPARVIHLVYMGTSTTYLLERQDGERITTFSQNEKTEPEFGLGDQVYAAWEAASCFLLKE